MLLEYLLLLTYSVRKMGQRQLSATAHDTNVSQAFCGDSFTAAVSVNGRSSFTGAYQLSAAEFADRMDGVQTTVDAALPHHRRRIHHQQQQQRQRSASSPAGDDGQCTQQRRAPSQNTDVNLSSPVDADDDDSMQVYTKSHVYVLFKAECRAEHICMAMACYRPHRQRAMHRCSLLLQMSHVDVTL